VAVRRTNLDELELDYDETEDESGVAVYSDSDKMGVWPVPGGGADHVLVRQSTRVDYYDGET
jgi:hypothetical protein